MNSIDYNLKEQLREKVDSYGWGDYSFEWPDNKIYYISKDPNRPLYLGVVKLAEKALAEGGFGKIYDVHSIEDRGKFFEETCLEVDEALDVELDEALVQRREQLKEYIKRYLKKGLDFNFQLNVI